MKTKITMEIARERMIDTQGKYKFNLVEWNGTNNKAKVMCKACGHIIQYSNGKSIYDSPSECPECKWHSWNRVHAKKYRSNYEQMLEDGIVENELRMEIERKAEYFENRVEQYEARRDLLELVS